MLPKPLQKFFSLHSNLIKHFPQKPPANVSVCVYGHYCASATRMPVISVATSLPYAKKTFFFKKPAQFSRT